MQLETNRLIMKTNIKFVDDKLYEKKMSGIGNILEIKPISIEDHGFGFYLKENPDIQVCHFGIRTDRRLVEISYGTAEDYRNNGYMKEAVPYAIRWIFENSSVNEIYGLICENDKSEKIIRNCGFELESQHVKEKWYVYRRK
jgi:hypothetical protein